MAGSPRVSVQFTVDSTNYTAAVNKAKAQMIDFGEASKRVSHSTITDVQATSGALRLLDGGIQNNIRAAERFAASIKGVGAAVQFLYPVVGLVAIGAVVARGVTELTNFIKKTKEAGEQFRASFQEMVNSSRLSNDELAKTNVELENQIAKLTGKHENVLATQLVQTRIEADKLAMSAAAAAKQIKELLEKNQVGILGQILQQGSTSDAFGNINNFQKLKEQSQQDRSDALHRGDQGGADAASKKYQQILQNERAWLQTNLKGYKSISGGAGGDQSQNITALQAALNLNYDQGDRIDEDAQNQKDTGQLKKIQDAQNVANKAKEAAAKLMEQYRQQYAQVQASTVIQPGEEAGQYHARMLTEEAMFWSQKLSINKKGSIAYKDIQQQLAEVDRQTNQQAAEAQSEALRLAKEQEKFIEQSFGSDLDLTRNSDVMGNLKGGGKDADSMLAAMNEGVAIARANADAWAEAQIQIGEAAGTLSKYDAALQAMQLHRQQNDRANAGVASSRAALEQRYGPEASAVTPEARAAYGKLNNQQSALNGQYQVQAAQDQQSVNSQTPFGAWKQSLDQFVQQSRDTASQVRDIWSNALSSVNDEIVKIISTRHNYNTRVEFGNLGASMFRNVAGAGLQKAEGALLGGLGLGGGKADGSAGKPFHVIVAGATAGASATGGGLISKMFGGSTGSSGGSTATSSGGGGGFLSSIGSFASKIFSGLGFADGGMPPVGMASLVGENGPELFVPTASGVVVPNSSTGGGDTHHNWNIDARGANDPAAVNAAVQRGISRAMPSIAAATTHAQQNGKSRMPPSRR
jgi:hypothetical protein